MQGHSKKEIQVISDLEFRKKYYFKIEDIKKHFVNKKNIKDFIYNMRKKGRIIKINRKKYFLIPIKARTGKWSDNPIIIADEICDGKDYFIAGWFAANYWGLTEHISVQVDIYTTRRQGKLKILNTRFIFHRTTQKRISEAVTEKLGDKEFKIISKEDAKKWMKSRK